MKKTLFDPATNRVLVATKEVAQAGWNRFLPNPLEAGEKVIVLKVQNPKQLEKGFIAIKRKNHESVFSLHHFTDLKGRTLKIS